MKYNKQELAESKKAYDSALGLCSTIGKLNNNDSLDILEAAAWLLCGGLAAFVAIVAADGAGADFDMLVNNLTPVLPSVGKILAPAVCLTVFRKGGVALLKRIQKSKFEQGQLYVQYEDEKSRINSLTKYYKRAVDKIVELSNSNNEQDKETIKSIVKEIERTEEKYKITSEQWKQIETTLDEHFESKTKSLSKEDKEKLYKFLGSISKVR